MSHRELNLQNEPNNKRKKTNSEYTKWINDSMSNMTGMPYVEYMPLEETTSQPFSPFKNIPFTLKDKNSKLSICEYNNNYRTPPNVYNDVGVLPSNFNTKSVSEEQGSNMAGINTGNCH